ncbi:hypothetical protein J6590_067500 [Homalodisca vitripennis]|nr:hypothetical protein J6590_067500 [Homalodisca vitripennis]
MKPCLDGYLTWSYKCPICKSSSFADTSEEVFPPSLVAKFLSLSTKAKWICDAKEEKDLN